MSRLLGGVADIAGDHADDGSTSIDVCLRIRQAPHMPPKTIYVRQDDMRVWQRAGAYAKERRLSLSALIMTALEAYLEAEESSR